MAEKKAYFFRKDDYKENVITRIKSIIDKHDDILFVPNEKCVKGYYKGLVLFEKITDKCENLVKRSPHKKWDEGPAEILDVIGKGMPRDKERKTQQIIALNNMPFSDGSYSVCGFETVISTNDIKIEGKGGGPEIDLVAIRPDKDPKKRSILLIEYKCLGSSMIKGNQDIVHHYNDYKQILEWDGIDVFKQQMIKSYKLLCEFYDVKPNEKYLDPKDYKVQIAFLFVDKVIDEKRNVESEITSDDYDKAWNMLKENGADLSDVLYIRCRKVEDVNLNLWKPLKNTHLKITN